MEHAQQTASKIQENVPNTPAHCTLSSIVEVSLSKQTEIQFKSYLSPRLSVIHHNCVKFTETSLHDKREAGEEVQNRNAVLQGT